MITINEDNNEKENSDVLNTEKAESINQAGQANMQGRHGNIFCLSIIGQIEGHMILPPQNKATKYEHIIPLLVSIEEDKIIEGLLVILNTMGGDVEAGLAIAEMISGMKKPTVSLVLGGGHSIGVPLAVAARYSYIAPSATMIVHPIRMNGTVISVPQTFDYLVKMQERVVNFIVAHSNITEEKLNALMLNNDQLINDVGSMVFGEDAVKCGLISSVGTVSDALDKLQELIKERAVNNTQN